MQLTALTPCYQTHDKALLYQVTIRRGWESRMRPHSWKQCHSPCSPVRTNLMLLCTCYRGGGGGLVAKSCLTLATPWTVACQAPLSMGFSRQEYWSGLLCLVYSNRFFYLCFGLILHILFNFLASGLVSPPMSCLFLAILFLTP